MTTGEALIVAARLAAAHEGEAEMIVEIQHANSGISQVPLDHFAAAALMQACAAEMADDLIGHGWSKVRDALQAAYTRFEQAPGAGRN